MHGQDRAGPQEFQGEVAVGHGVHGVGRRPVEAQTRRRHVAVDGKRRAGQGRRAERRFVHAPAAVGEPAAVAAEHLHVGHHVVPEGHRLAGLQVRVARHHRPGVGLGLVDQGRLQVAQAPVQVVDRIAHPEPEVGRHLVVARAGGVQAPGRLADQAAQAGLHVHVDVFQGPAELEGPGFDLSQNRV